MLCELILYCIYSMVMIFASKHLDSVLTSLLSSVLAVAVFFIPVIIYTRIAEVKLSALIYPNEKSSDDRTRNPSKLIFVFIFALAMTLTAVNVVSLATDAVFSFFSAPPEKSAVLTHAEWITLFIRNVLVAAIFEELLLRGVVLNATRNIRNLKRILISALFFALIHCNLRSFFYAFAAGAVIAYFTLKTNSVIFGIALHFSQNCVTFVFTLLTQLLKKDTYDLVSAICFFVLLAVAIIGLIFTVLYEHKHRFIAPETRKNDNSRSRVCIELIAFTVAAALITAITF